MPTTLLGTWALCIAREAFVADPCVFRGSASVTPAVKREAEAHTYILGGTIYCADAMWDITGSGSGVFGCVEPGTSIATIKIDRSPVATITFQHAGGATMTGFGATPEGYRVGAELLFLTPMDGGTCSSTGLRWVDLGGAFMFYKRVSSYAGVRAVMIHAPDGMRTPPSVA